MKKLFATFLLLICVSVAFAGNAGDSGNLAENPDTPVCLEKNVKGDPSGKDCQPTTCGCFFHQIEEFVVGLFS